MQTRIPLPEHVASLLRKRIADRTLLPGGTLPSEREMAEAFDVSRGTLRLALAQVRDEGLIQSVSGKGWLVCEQEECADDHTKDEGCHIVFIGRTEHMTPVFTAHIRAQLKERACGHMESVLIDSFDSIDGAGEALDLEKVSGVLLFSDKHPPEAFMERLQKADVPLVILALQGHANCDTVANDRSMNAEMTVDYLFNKGHRSVLHVVSEHFLAEVPAALQSQLAFDAAIKRRGMEGRRYTNPEEYWYRPCDEQAFIAYWHELAQQGALPTAIYSESNIVSKHIIGYLDRMHLRVPKDVSLMGPGLGNEQPELEPYGLTRLTVIASDLERMVHIALDKLWARMTDTTAPESLTLTKPFIIEGESVGLAPQSKSKK